jgi:hypothetical protein
VSYNWGVHARTSDADNPGVESASKLEPWCRSADRLALGEFAPGSTMSRGPCRCPESSSIAASVGVSTETVVLEAVLHQN